MGRQPFFHARERLFEPVRAHGLQQIIHGVDLERADGVRIVSGDENNRWRGIESLEHFEPIELGHLNIQKDEIRVSFGDGFHGLKTVGAFGDDFDLRVGREIFPERLAGGPRSA